MKPITMIVESEIGKRIRELRKRKGKTLEELAKEAGFTKGYLSKIEKSEKSPPVSTLGIIAQILGVTISALLGEENNAAPISIVRKDDRPLISRDSTVLGYSFEAMAHNFSNKIMEPFILTLPLKLKRKTFHRHEGHELLFVLEGTMKFQHGDEVFILKEGDCAYFDSGYPHLGESLGPKEVKCFMVICSPHDN